MSQSAGLFKSTLIYTIGNLGSRILSFVLVPLYTIYLSKSQMGLYDLIITTASLLIPLITLQISDAVYRWLLEAREDRDKVSVAITNSFVVLLISVISFICLCTVIAVFAHFDFFIYTVLYILSNIFMLFLQQVARGLGNNKLYATAGILNTFMMVLFTVIFFVLLNWGLPGILLAGIISGIITSLVILNSGKLFQYFNLSKASKVEVRSMIKYSWPLIPNAVGWWLINEINRFLILLFIGVEANGIFAISARFPSLLVMINSIFLLSWQDLAVAAKGNKDTNKAAYSKIFNSYMVLEFTVVILLIAVSRYLVEIMIDPKFFESWKYMPLLYLSVAFASFSSFLGASYLNVKKTKRILLTTLAGSIVNIVICIALIKPAGLFAPAAGTLSGYFTMWLIRAYETRTFFSIKINYRLFITLLLVSFLMAKLVFIDNLLVNIAVVVFALLLVIFLNRPLFKFIRQQLFHNNLTGLRSKST